MQTRYSGATTDRPSHWNCCAKTHWGEWVVGPSVL
jgi:hypothetical protein